MPNVHYSVLAAKDVAENAEYRRLGHCRSFTTGNYVVFYRAVSDGVDIVRILRAERDIDGM